MTTLVYGPYPPSGGPEADQTLALVRSLVADGADVVVASPRPSAAHHHFDVGGAKGALALLRASGPVERAFVRLDAEGLQADVDAPRLRVARALLGRTFRRIGDVELRLDRVPAQANDRWARAVVIPATSVLVGTDVERDALVRAGVDRGRVRLLEEAEPSSPTKRGTLPAWSGTTRDAIQRDVRRRAAAARASSGDASASSTARASAPLREIGPLALTPIQSSKPGVVHLKRFIRRLVAWQLDPIIQHLNRLHRASVAAVDQLDQASTRSTSAIAVERNDRSEA